MLDRMVGFWERWQAYLLGVGGGLLFVVVFSIAYGKLPAKDYANRDDGVITLSHARNLVDHGFIGVEPSGQRVEGFSAPLQFWVYVIVYGITGVGWHVFDQWQTVICTFWLGFFVVQLFGKRATWALLLTLGIALLLSRATRFMAWHGSGMENPILHMGIAGVLALLHHGFDQGRVRWHWGIWIGLAMLVRLDSIFHFLPLLLVFGMAYHKEWRDRRVWSMLGVAMAVWGAYQVWRLLYFGSLSANTELAQGIDLGYNIKRLLTGDSRWIGAGLGLAWENMRVLGVWMAPFGLLVWPLVQMRPATRWLVLALGLLLVTAFFNPLFFGLTRLDPARTTTFASLATILLLGQLLAAIPWRRMRWMLLPLGGALVAVVLLEPTLAVKKPWICCGIHSFEQLVAEGRDFQEKNGLHRITVASPDLGKLSYGKQFNMFDMGYLGSPMISRLKLDEPCLRRYFYEFGLPDLLETHTTWSLEHATIYSDSRFRELYVPLHETRAGYLETSGGDWPDVTEGTFVRKALLASSGSEEYQLIQDLRRQLGTAPLQAALAHAVDADDPSAHQYVVRTAYRFMPEFRAAGLAEEVVALFAGTPSAAYDQAFLGSAHDRHWVERAWGWQRSYLEGKEMEKFQSHVEQPVRRRPWLLHSVGRVSLYLGPERRLWVSLFDPNPAELESLWLVHAYAHHAEDVVVPNPWKATFHEFNWDPACAVVDHGQWLQVLQMPDYPLEKLMVGRLEKGILVFSESIMMGIWGRQNLQDLRNAPSW